MKKIYPFLFTVIASTAAVAQNANAVVFSELGEKFTLFLNGVQQNATPQSNVKASGLTGEFFQARIDFEDASKADFAENNFRVGQGLEVTYMVKLNKKGAYVLRFAGEAAISVSTVAVTTTAPVSDDSKRIADVDNESTTSTTVVETTEGDDIVMDTDVTVVETTTKTGTKPAATSTKGEKVSVGMNVGGINMGVNINVEETGDDMVMDVEEDAKVTTTTTTTKTTTKANTATNTTRPREEVVVVEKVTGCGAPMSATSFATAKKNIADKGFDETRLSTAKTIIKTNCMSAAQIKDVCDTFGFEETKLDFAKYAYDYCSDTNNYFVVNETFSFSSSTDELNTFIQSK